MHRAPLRIEMKDNTKVLAVNKGWFPIEIVTHKDAFRLMCKGHAKAMETIENSYVMHTMESWMDMHMHENYDKINTVSMEIPVPEIIVLTEYDKIPKRFINFSKGNLLIRDNYTCGYCGCEVTNETGTIDHIHPQSKGGQTNWTNCIIACMKCNHKKADNLPYGQFKPRVKAKEPKTPSPIYRVNDKLKKTEYPKSWEPFLMKT